MKLPALTLSALLLAGCASSPHKHEARFLAVSALDSATTYAAMQGGAVERNPLYQSDDAATVALTSFALSCLVAWGIHKLVKRLPEGDKDDIWFMSTVLRGFGIPYNLNSALQ